VESVKNYIEEKYIKLEIHSKSNREFNKNKNVNTCMLVMFVVVELDNILFISYIINNHIC